MQALDDLKDNIQMQAPPGLQRLLHDILRSKATLGFLLGAGIEALGLTLQFQYMGVSYPTLDFVFCLAAFLALAWYQQKEDQKDMDEEDDDVEE